MGNSSFDVVIVGAGIVGLATGMKLQKRYPGIKAAILEKEYRVAAHQTGHNSGVIHSGIYYKPGSLKARLCVSGSRELVGFCVENDVPHDICGKVVVATEQSQIPALDELYRRGIENGAPGLRMLDSMEIGEYEPHVRGLRGLLVPGTGIVDFGDVARAYAKVFRREGGEILL
ncbi:MAG: FAD-dependent oxidoreductase, partial [Syntrophobacteraceae bacterium]